MTMIFVCPEGQKAQENKNNNINKSNKGIHSCLNIHEGKHMCVRGATVHAYVYRILYYSVSM